MAAETRQMAYVPYSGYQVGAALVGASGMVYSGCNVENASFGLTICAERAAVAKAISEGEETFHAIV
ncbi:MAG: cytidine deaminase, partial [Candidatus Roseilinea sp.]|uniref:cytidine deaminase n=1 Tax=Candidatus Roseilinea sp. TaxID=2838777 RepID=UPI004049199C